MVARNIVHTLYADGVPIMTVERLCTDSYSYSDFARETAKQQLAIDRALAQQKLGLMYPSFLTIDMNICQAKQFMPETKLESLPEPETKLESLPEPEPVYKEKINVKWYELLLLAALALAPFMLGLLLKFLNS